MHQHSVALRSLRSALGLLCLMAPSSQLEALLEDVQWLMSGLNDARDWDEFVTQTLPLISQACPTVNGFDALGRIAEEHRHKAQERARSVIASARTGRFQVALGRRIEQAGWRAAASTKGVRLLNGPAPGRGRPLCSLIGPWELGDLCIKRLLVGLGRIDPSIWPSTVTCRRWTSRIGFVYLAAVVGLVGDAELAALHYPAGLPLREPVPGHLKDGW